MQKLASTVIILTILFPLNCAFSQDDLSPKKMEKVTSEILDLFVSGKTDGLGKYISHAWLDERNINVNKCLIDNYLPERYFIAFAVSNVCVAMLYGNSWTHLLVFKFTDENGTYRIIPKGVSEIDKEYIDPWWAVETYICEHKGK